MLNEHTLIKMKKKILIQSHVKFCIMNSWEVWPGRAESFAQPQVESQALLSSVTPLHKTHFEHSLPLLLSLCSQLTPVPQLFSTKLFIWLQLCFGRVKGEKTHSIVETMPTFMHYLLYQSYKLWEKSLVIECHPISMTVQIAQLHTVPCICHMWSNCCQPLT